MVIPLRNVAVVSPDRATCCPTEKPVVEPTVSVKVFEVIPTFEIVVVNSAPAHGGGVATCAQAGAAKSSVQQKIVKATFFLADRVVAGI
jgi:hypothetical protein